MIYSKTNPVGVDLKIQSLQTLLNEYLQAQFTITDASIDVFGRVYKEKIGEEVVPVRFVSGIDYKDVLWNSSKSIITFFYLRNDPINNKGMFTANVGNIFLVKVTDLSSATHRADNEIVKAITDYYFKEPLEFKVQDVSTDSVFIDFDFKTSGIEGMQPYFSFRIDLNINYR